MSTPGMPPLSVLVIDDDDGIRAVLEEAFQDEGYTVLSAPNGAAALEQLTGVPPVDLVVTDVKMPVMTGPEFMAAYRQSPGPHAPVIAIAASAEGLALAEAAHPAAKLSKPFDLDRLMDLAESVLRHDSASTCATPQRRSR